MSEKKPPFDIQPSVEFRARVLQAVETQLARNRENAAASVEPASSSRRWVWMTGLGLTLSGALAVLLFTKNDHLSDEDQALAVVDPELLENEELLADLEILEDWEDLESWEDS